MKNNSEDSDYTDFMKENVEVMADERHPAIKQIESYYVAISRIATHAETIVVENDESCRNALELSIEAKNIYKTIEQYRKNAIEPHRQLIQTVNECAKNLQASLAMIEGTIKVKLAAWQQIKLIEVQKAQESIKNLSESLGMDFSIVAPKQAKNMSSTHATTVTKETVGFVVIDANLIPLEYWTIDEKLIQRHIDLGKRDIPGIQVTVKKNLIIRKK